MLPSGVFFTGANGRGENSLYWSDGTSPNDYRRTDGSIGGTLETTVLPAGGVSRLQALGNGLVVFQLGQNEIWVSDATASGTRLLAAGSAVEVLRPGVAAFLSTESFLTITDGSAVTRAPGMFSQPRFNSGIGFDAQTVSGTLADQGDGSATFILSQTGAFPRYFNFNLADTAAYAPAAAPGPYGTWFNIFTGPGMLSIAPSRFEALPVPGRAMAAINPSGNSSGLARLDGDRAIISFQLATDFQNRELYVASLAGVSLVRDINPAGGSEPAQLASVGGGRVAFTATDGGTNQEPWITDGTSAGTIPLGDLRPGATGSGAYGFTPLGDGRFVFGADDGVNGPEPWISDGTAAGTRLLADLQPGFLGSSPQGFTSLPDGRVAFVATTPAARQLVFTDGTAAGTQAFGPANAASPAAGQLSLSSPLSTSGADILAGGAAGDFQRGGLGDDVLRHSAGDDVLDGGAGRDVADYTAQVRRDWTSAYTPVDGLTLSQTGERDLFIGIESARFADGRLVFDAEDHAAQVHRLYQAAFGRAPDEAGLHASIAALATATPGDVAVAAIASAEFRLLHGSGLDNAGFVQSLYRPAFGRDADATGLQTWTAFLDAGGARADVLVGFTQSLEMRTATATRLSTGLWDVDERAAQIARLYLAGLDRAPDKGGFLTAVASSEPTMRGLATDILGSVEFNQRPAGTDEAFITRIYNQALDRAPDPGGFEHYRAALASGTARADVLLAISESPEHQLISQPVVMPADALGIVFV